MTALRSIPLVLLRPVTWGGMAAGVPVTSEASRDHRPPTDWETGGPRRPEYGEHTSFIFFVFFGLCIHSWARTTYESVLELLILLLLAPECRVGLQA